MRCLHMIVSHNNSFTPYLRTRALLGEPGTDVEVKVPLGIEVLRDDGRLLGV